MMYVFDTSSILAFLEGEKGAEAVGSLIREVESGKAEGIISPLVTTEVHYFYARRDSVEKANEILFQLKFSGLRTLPIDEDIAVRASSYKLKGLPIADAYVAATAKMLRAKLVADDRHFADLDIDLFKFR